MELVEEIKVAKRVVFSFFHFFGYIEYLASIDLEGLVVELQIP